MAVSEKPLPSASASPLAGMEAHLTRLLVLDWEKIAYLVIFVVAVISRFWDLGARVMSHDESLHTRYSWGLYRGDGFAHTPLMHGPLLFHMVALSYLLFGDNDFTARIYPAVLGILLVLMPYLLRKWLGRLGAISASALFLISPLILYYSRYIREDIPAIFGAMIMVIAIWRYIESRENKYLLWLSFGQFYLFASKEVSFIYVAIFGSFLTLYFIVRLLDVKWGWRWLYTVFVILVIAFLVAVVAYGLTSYCNGALGRLAEPDEALPPPQPQWLCAPVASFDAVAGLYRLLPLSLVALAALIGLSVLVGQWRNLRRFPELDVMIVMGTLILPSLTPFAILAGGHSPTDTSPEAIQRGIIYVGSALAITVLVGAIWGIKPPARPNEDDDSDVKNQSGGFLDSPLRWLGAFFTSRWWVIAGLYWALFFFFFTTMFTNRDGVATGIVGSLGYWLDQQEVQRADQPGYYYLLVMLPIYEFLPVILSLAAGVVGLVRLIVRAFYVPPVPADSAEQSAEESAEHPAPRQTLDLDAPIHFPVFLFTAYWIVMNLLAYSVAGEKMPWLTTHLTTPMILVGGWMVGQLLERVRWQALWRTGGWFLVLLIPVAAVGLLRLVAPLCRLTPTSLLCNSIIPVSYQTGAFGGLETPELAATSLWIATLIVFAAALAAVIVLGRRVGVGQVFAVMGLCAVGLLGFQTTRAAWRAAYVRYDEATEFLVYAHSAGAVKDVLDQIEEISFKLTDGYGLRVAYDNEVSWPFSWYLRDYYNAVYFGDQPSRGLIGDAPVVLAGPENWASVESLLGDRYYRFEYIRMWWPMQDYFDLDWQDIRNFLQNPALQRGVWDIFINRDYSAYSQATGHNLEISQWPLAARMRLYIRRDVFAQVWDYGVTASEAAQATDPYSQNALPLAPELVFGQGLLSRPHGLAIGPDNLLYVADSANHRIVVFDQDGNLVRMFGAYGIAPQTDVLNEPWDVAVAPDGTVSIADTWNHRIVEYSEDGQYITSRGYEGPNILTDPLAMWGPRGIAVDPQGTVYLADTGNKRILVFSDEGVFIRQIGSGGAQDGQVDEPVGLAVSADGLLYVADTWNQRIDVFTTAGVFVRQWVVEGWFAQSNERPYIAVDEQGRVYVTDPEAFRVIVFDSSGQYLFSFGDFATINLAGGIAVGPQGRLFISDTAAGTIQRYVIPETIPAGE